LWLWPVRVRSTSYFVEQRAPRGADPHVAAVARVDAREREVHEDDDHLHAGPLGTGRLKRLLEPLRLQVRRRSGWHQRHARGIRRQRPGVLGRLGLAVVRGLPVHVVAGEGDEQDGADLEAVEVPLQAVAVPVGQAVVRQQEAREVGAVAVGPVVVAARAPARLRDTVDVGHAPLELVVARNRHPRKALGDRGVLQRPGAPRRRRVGAVRVGEVSDHQVEQRRAVAVARTRHTGRGQRRHRRGPLIAERREPEGSATGRSGPEGRRGRSPRHRR
jgi:hypothetical protein